MAKEKTIKVWVTEFEGHKIKVTNEGKAKLWIDGVEVAKEKGLVHLEYEMRAPIPNTDYIVIAKLDGSKQSIVTCDIHIAVKMNVTFGKENEDGLFTAYTDKEIQDMKDEADAAIAISTASIFF